MKFTGNLLREGKLVVKGVTGEFVANDGAQRRGKFSVPNGAYIDAVPYELTTQDGQTAPILVKGFYVSGGSGLAFFEEGRSS